MRSNVHAIFCSAIRHGETGTIARLFTAERGLIGAYIHGGQSRRSRALLVPGNLLAAEIDSRGGDERLGRARLELSKNRTALAFSPLAAATASWVAALLSVTLPEDDPFPALFARTDALYDFLDADPDALLLARTLADYERAMLEDFGFGLDLDRCAAGGDSRALAYVSPRTGAAVSQEMGKPYAKRMFRLPTFWSDPHSVLAPADVKDALALTGHFLMREAVPAHKRAGLTTLRERIDALLERLL